MKKIIYIFLITSIVLNLVGCKDTSIQEGEGSSSIPEAEVVNENKPSVTKKNDEIAQVEPGQKVNITEDIKSEVLEIVPGLTDYKVGTKLTDSMKFKFVYYGYCSSDLSRYSKKELDIEGKKNTWALIPKTEVEAKFKEVFGLELGEYKPTLNENDPTVYYANEYYYICTSAQRDTINYSLLKEDDSTVKIKMCYEGDERYNEINVKLQTANNTKGYIITEVVTIPK